MDEAEEAERIERGRVLFAGPVVFERGAARLQDLPEGDLPEIAFAGRSNVGKSSLINALFSRKALARASAEPGRTRELNFFRLGETLRIVDLPGYGYARAAKADIARWNALMRGYLRGRAPLKRIVLLVDARHGLKPNDEEAMAAFDKAASVYQIVLTKADKLRAGEVEAVVADTAARAAKRPAAHPLVIATSAETGLGLETLRADLAALA
jgi:GTP-binding protein